MAAIVAVPCLVLFASMPGRRAATRRRDQPLRLRAAALGVLVPAHNEEARDSGDARIDSGTTGGRRPAAGHCRQLLRYDGPYRERNAAPRCSNERSRRGEAKATRSKAAWRCSKSRPPDVGGRRRRGLPTRCPAVSTPWPLRSRQTHRPAQACYLMTPPACPAGDRCHLVAGRAGQESSAASGHGEAGAAVLDHGLRFGISLAGDPSRSFAGGNIVEDMQFAVDLALAGFSPSYCDAAVGAGRFARVPFGIREPAPALGARASADASRTGPPAVGGFSEDRAALICSR